MSEFGGWRRMLIELTPYEHRELNDFVTRLTVEARRELPLIVTCPEKYVEFLEWYFKSKGMDNITVKSTDEATVQKVYSKYVQAIR